MQRSLACTSLGFSVVVALTVVGCARDPAPSAPSTPQTAASVPSASATASSPAPEGDSGTTSSDGDAGADAGLITVRSARTVTDLCNVYENALCQRAVACKSPVGASCAVNPPRANDCCVKNCGDVPTASNILRDSCLSAIGTLDCAAFTKTGKRMPSVCLDTTLRAPKGPTP